MKKSQLFKDLANLLSILSLFCGFISVIFSLEKHFTFAAWAIILSAVFDGLDGQVARLNSVPSEFGKELDSLVDVVAFGIAPSILGYVFIYKEFQALATLSLFIYLACSVWRLAKYNITPKGEMPFNFIGLPTTASGGMLASFVLIYRKQEDMLIPQFVPKILSPEFTPLIFFLLVSILALLMISRVPYLNLDGLKKMFGKKIPIIAFFLFAVVVACGIFSKAGVIMFSYFLIYLLFSPFVVKRLSTQK